MRLQVFYISDHTAVTAERIGRCVLARFANLEFAETSVPFVQDEAEIDDLGRRLADAQRGGAPVIVFSTVGNPDLRSRLRSPGILLLDVFDAFEAPLTASLPGLVQRPDPMPVALPADYGRRIRAVNFMLAHDDGLGSDQAAADIIILGVSRSGKTPICVYLALEHGVLAANYPLTDEILQYGRLPEALRDCRGKLFGLLCLPEQLHRYREERRPGSGYASLTRCRSELNAAREFFSGLRIPYLNSDGMSVEEVAARIRLAGRLPDLGNR